MSIKYAVMALLAEKPMHGYAVHAALERRLGDLWELNYGQVYQVLTALERTGSVTASEARVGRRPWRRVYTLSPLGDGELRQWIREGAARPRPFRDDFFIRLLFADPRSPADVTQLIRREIQQARARLASFAVPREPMPTAGVPHQVMVRHLYLEAAILHLEANVKALELCRESFVEPRPSETATRREPAMNGSGTLAPRGRSARPLPPANALCARALTP